MAAFAQKDQKSESQRTTSGLLSENHRGISVEKQSDRSGLQQLSDNSSQVKQFRAYQDMANDFTSQPVQRKANNTGLPDHLKTGIEQLSGITMDDVQVHYNSSQPAQLNAHAYAQGTQIHLAAGQEKHLPHEAWHVVQQKQGRVKPTAQLKGKVAINDDARLEKEADEMGNLAIQRKESFDPIPAMNEKQMSSPGSEVAQLYKISYFPAATATLLVKGGKAVDKVQESDGALIENITQKDYETAGSPTTDPVRTVSRFMTNMTGVSFIAGHMLNKHLLGEGDINKNITSISASANSQQSKRVEEPAKAAVRAKGSDVNYWTKVTHRGTVAVDDNNYVEGHALQIETGYVDNNTGAGITEVINTIAPLKASNKFVAKGFGGEVKAGGYKDKLAQARTTTLSFVTEGLKEVLKPEDVFKLLMKNTEDTGRHYEAYFAKYLPNMPDSVVQTYAGWRKAPASLFKDPSPEDLFMQLSNLDNDIWVDIFLAIKYPDKTLWEKLEEFIEKNGEVPDDPSKASKFILKFQSTL